MQVIKDLTVTPTRVFKGACSTLWTGPRRLWRTTCVTRSACLWGRGQAGCPVPTTACWETGAHGATAAWWGFRPDQRHQHQVPADPALIPFTWQKQLLWTSTANLDSGLFLIAGCGRYIWYKLSTFCCENISFTLKRYRVIWVVFSPVHECRAWTWISHWGWGVPCAHYWPTEKYFNLAE